MIVDSHYARLLFHMTYSQNSVVIFAVADNASSLNARSINAVPLAVAVSVDTVSIFLVNAGDSRAFIRFSLTENTVFDYGYAEYSQTRAALAGNTSSVVTEAMDTGPDSMAEPKDSTTVFLVVPFDPRMSVGRGSFGK
jgi:hypothetical protein